MSRKDDRRNLWKIDWNACTQTGCMCPIHERDNHVRVESTKLERKLRDTLNRITKLIPSVKRISELDRIAVELEAEAEKMREYEQHNPSGSTGYPDGLDADALTLRRLEFDLTSMREAKVSAQPKKEQTMRAGSKYEASQWPRGERP